MDLFWAEWRKMIGNRWLSGCFIGLWPLSAFSISLLLLVVVAVDDGTRQRFVDSPYQWTDASLFFWLIPDSIIGRLLIIGFTAGLFAGEYQWGTWKNLLQRRGRVSLILMKFVTLAVFILIAFGLTSVIWVLGMGLVQLLAGGSYPPALNQIPANYWGELSLQIGVAFLSTLIIAAIAALVALITRSILASVILGIFSVFIDGFIGAALIIVYWASELRFVPSLYRFTISYNVDNLLNWANFGQSSAVLGNVSVQDNPIFGTLAIDPPLTGNHYSASLLILSLWVIILVSLAVYSFYRQEVS